MVNGLILLGIGQILMVNAEKRKHEAAKHASAGCVGEQ